MKPWDHLLESDKRLRELERRWKSTGMLEDELAYVRENIRSKGQIELTDLSVEFTRSKEGRKLFYKLHSAHKLGNLIRINSKPFSLQAIEVELRSYIGDRINGGNYSIYYVAIGWRSWQTPGYNVYFTVTVDTPYADPREMCAALVMFGSNVSWQNVNLYCSHNLNRGSSDIHKDTILIRCPYSTAWATHINAGN